MCVGYLCVERGKILGPEGRYGVKPRGISLGGPIGRSTEEKDKWGV